MSRLAWPRQRPARRLDSSTAEDASPAAMAEIDSALATLGSIAPAEGFEARIFAAMQARLSHETSNGWNTRWLYSWHTAAATAALLCVVTGGVLVVREAGIAASHTVSAPAAPTTSYAQAPVNGNGIGTATARRQPAAPILAGQRRGRAAIAARPVPSGKSQPR